MRILAPSPRNGIKLHWHGDGSVSVTRPAARTAVGMMAMDAAIPRSGFRTAKDQETGEHGSALDRLMQLLQDKLDQSDLQAAAQLIDEAIDQHVRAMPEDEEMRAGGDQPEPFPGRPERQGGLGQSGMAQDARAKARMAAAKAMYARFPDLKRIRSL